MSVRKIVVGTDVLFSHLRGRRRPSVLRVAMGKFFCYTTVFTAIELFKSARSAREQRAVEDTMAAMKVLGLNPKNAAAYGRLFQRYVGRRQIDLLVAGLCRDSGLPLLTGRTVAFRGIRGLTLLTPGDILEAPGATTRVPVRSMT